MGLKIVNNAYGILTAGITSGATTIPLQTGHGARFGTLGAGEFLFLTLINGANQLEVVKITAIAGDNLTAVRGQDGTTAIAFSAGDRIEDRPCRAAMLEFLLKSDFGSYAATLGLVPTTGDVKPTFKTVADTSWVMMDDGTIGAAASGATTRANADTEALFTLLWNNIINQWAPVAGGRGGSAAADFAANKTLRLPRQLGRALAVGGLGSFTSVFTADVGTDVLTIDSNSSVYTGAVVRVSNSGGALPTPLLAATDYFAIRTGATTAKLATTLANAHAGTAIDITGAGSGTNTLTMSLTSRALGEHVGEEAHSQKGDESGPHIHGITDPGHVHFMNRVCGGSGFINFVGAAGMADISPNTDSATTGITINSAGSGTPHNVMQPSSFMNVMIKL